MRIFVSYLLIGIISVFLFSCGNEEKAKKIEAIQEEIEIVQEIKSPANVGSSISNLHIGATGTVYLTWTESQEDGKTILYYSTLEDNKWQEPIKIAEGDDWIVNWADFPSLTQFGNNSLVVNYLVETNRETFAYDIKLLISNDNGQNWGNPFLPHNDGTQTEHGFVSLVPYLDETFMAIWLDGRKYDTGEDEMTLRAAIINKDGKIEQEFVLDQRVCDCCATDAVVTKNGIAVVYRNRDENEIRDMSIVYFKDGEWSEPKLIAKDNWMIAGCPVNGPAIDATGNKTSLIWFTLLNDTPTVRFVFLDNNSTSFSTPIKVNTQVPVGRVDVCSIDEKTAVVSWMEEDNEATYLKIRTIKTDGTRELGAPIIITKMNGSRSSGFPKMIKKGNQLIIAWTDTEDSSHIKTTLINLSELVEH